MPGRFDPVELLRVLHEHGVELVVIGGTGAVLQGVPILTQDLDVMPAREVENLARLATALTTLNARLRVVTEPEGVAFPIEPRVLAGSRSWTLTTDRGNLDIVFEPAGMTDYQAVAAEAELMEVIVEPSVMVLVASLASIIRSKQAAGRAKDQAVMPIMCQTLDEIERRRRPPRR